MANRRISDLTALTAPATGDLLPIVDISEALAADKNKKITYGELLASAPAGSAAAPSFSFDGDPNTGLFNPGEDTLAFAEGGVEAMRIDSSGTLLIGASTKYSAVTSQSLYTANAGTFAAPGIGVGAYTTAGVGLITIDRSKNNTLGTNTIVADDDIIGFIQFRGANGVSSFFDAATISSVVDGTPGSASMPGRLEFRTTPSGSTVSVARMQIKSTGIVNIADTPTYADNAAATSGGLVAGDIYRKSDGTLMICY